MEDDNTLPFKKRRKLAFSPNSCCFCNKTFQGNRTILNPKKFNSLLTINKTRSDEFSVNIFAYESEISDGEITVSYHKACRAKLMHPFYSSASEKVKEGTPPHVEETPNKFTRSKKDDIFNW
ncbi:hypothetical protein DPMN_107910 [Dreissena polymorpha]|uniref:Uncharacterized protein n=1 Tax=Dreissena polymorpha TaxID=45954 RepID=A0A9D4K7V9_DREPO|nr:hypothetical protein DPMN_107910 [Dreissena polymorpha]